ncbi:protein of unknown function [Amycolatopsis arida]|uniref:DUF4288 domain-containing protein n=1 Tax=Amycolatopsis arida TaxID=587909 RepID=A0A1I5MLV8_9PSEU|nr:DUF4288 domain-containing protein [Amycolatopsis arida]TDX94133.1 uncharacterized protein DUF4288 [Amycolatopsis arida]SFP10490.1 protein of unknown function [Amycolatopsis arida]
MGVFSAVLVYSSTGDGEGYVPLYEESVVLLVAETEEAARERAWERGRARQVSYHNELGELISWRLLHVVDVSEVTDELADGAEVHSRHFRNYAAYRSFEPLLSGEEL